MTDKTTSTTAGAVPLKLLWQAILVVALVAIVWVVAQTLPGMQGVDSKKDVSSRQTLQTGTGAEVRFYRLPRVGDDSALREINTRVAGAQKEVIVVARQLAATSVLTNLKTRMSAGVKILVLLSPDTTADFARSKLFEWIRDNQLKGVYRDAMTSASHIMVIDGRTVVISDLPFSQRAYEVPDEATAKTAALGFVYIIDDENLAGQLAETFRQRAQVQNKIL